MIMQAKGHRVPVFFKLVLGLLSRAHNNAKNYILRHILSHPNSSLNEKLVLKLCCN